MYKAYQFPRNALVTKLFFSLPFIIGGSVCFIGFVRGSLPLPVKIIATFFAALFVVLGLLIAFQHLDVVYDIKNKRILKRTRFLNFTLKQLVHHVSGLDVLEIIKQIQIYRPSNSWFDEEKIVQAVYIRGETTLFLVYFNTFQEAKEFSEMTLRYFNLNTEIIVND